LEALEAPADRRQTRLAELDAAALAPQVAEATKALAGTTTQIAAAKAAFAREIKIVHVFQLVTR
jgi:hypothetical protein